MKKVTRIFSILLALTWFAASVPALSAQDYDDDLYYSPSKAKKEAEKRRKEAARQQQNSYNYQPAADYAGSDSYTVSSSRPLNVDVDTYNRHGSYTPPTNTAAGTELGGDSFENTRRIERFHNSDVVAQTGDTALMQYYYSQPESQPINVYVVNSIDPWYSWNYTPSWRWRFGSPYWSFSWGYDPWYDWAWGPSWSWGWGPSWSWGWGPSWSWGGYWPGYWGPGYWGPGYWGPSWGGSWGGNWGYNRPGANRPHNPSYGNGMAGNRPHSSSGGTYRPGNNGRPGNSGRPVYGQSNGTNRYPGVRPGSNGSNNGGYTPSNNNNRGRNNGYNSNNSNNGSNRRNSNSYNNNNNSNSNRNHNYNSGSFSRPGNSGFGGGGGFGGGSRGGGGGGASRGRGR